MKKEKLKQSLLADDLASLESYIHDLFHFCALPVCFVSPIGVLLEVNPTFEEMSKFRSYELIGEPIEKVFDKSEIQKLSKETFKKGFVKGKEIKFFPRRGETKEVLIFTKVRRDDKGDAVGYFMSFFDLSQIKGLNKSKKRRKR